MSSPDNSILSSFVNIDLDDVNLESVESTPKDLSDECDDESKQTNQLTETIEPSLDTKHEHDHKKTNELLNNLGKQLMEDYSNYFRLNTSSQVRFLGV